MRSRNTLPVSVLFGCVASIAAAQTLPEDPATPHFTELVIVRPMVRADFDARVLDYFELRTALEDGLPAQHVTDNPAENIEIQRTLARVGKSWSCSRVGVVVVGRPRCSATRCRSTRSREKLVKVSLGMRET